MDLEPAPKDSAAHHNNFALVGEIIPDGQGDRSDAHALTDGASCCVALPNGCRVCEVGALSWVRTAPLLVHPKATAAALYRFKKKYFAMGLWRIPMGESKRFRRVQH